MTSTQRTAQAMLDRVERIRMLLLAAEWAAVAAEARWLSEVSDAMRVVSETAQYQREKLNA